MDWTITRSVDPQRRDQAAVVGDDDAAGGLDRHDRPLDRIPVGVGRDEFGEGPPVADVVPVVHDFEDADIRGLFHHGLVDRAPSPSLGYSRAMVWASSEVPSALRTRSRASASLGRCVARASRMARAFQTKIPAFQANRPSARNRSAVARSGFSRNWTTLCSAIALGRAERLAALDVAVAGLGPGRLDAEGDEGGRVGVDHRERGLDGGVERLVGADDVVGRQDDHRAVGVLLGDDRRRQADARGGVARARFGHDVRRSASSATASGPPRPGRRR